MVNWPSFHLFTPLSLPIQILPSRPTSNTRLESIIPDWPRLWKQRIRGNDRAHGRADPDVAFPIFKKRQHRVARKAVVLRNPVTSPWLTYKSPWYSVPIHKAPLLSRSRRLGVKGLVRPGRCTSPLCRRQPPTADGLAVSWQ